MLTNWIGDVGFLERLHVQVRRHNITGDLTTCTGRITGVSLEERAIDLDILATNQRGNITATGEARVILPSRMTPWR
jgi:hypothetical protein